MAARAQQVLSHLSGSTNKTDMIGESTLFLLSTVVVQLLRLNNADLRCYSLAGYFFPVSKCAMFHASPSRSGWHGKSHAGGRQHILLLLSICCSSRRPSAHTKSAPFILVPPSILDGSSPLIASHKPTTIRNHERRILESSPAGTARQVRLFMIIISFEQAPESTDDPYPISPLTPLI